MKNKVFLSLLVILSLFVITGCNASSTLDQPSNLDNSNSSSANVQSQKNAYWYMNKKLTLKTGASNDGAHVTFSLPDSNGSPTKVTISGASKVDGHSIDGSYSLSVTECGDSQVYGKMSGNVDEKVVGLMASTIKGELVDGTGKTLFVDIYF